MQNLYFFIRLQENSLICQRQYGSRVASWARWWTKLVYLHFADFSFFDLNWRPWLNVFKSPVPEVISPPEVSLKAYSSVVPCGSELSSIRCQCMCKPKITWVWSVLRMNTQSVCFPHQLGSDWAESRPASGQHWDTEPYTDAGLIVPPPACKLNLENSMPVPVDRMDLIVVLESRHLEIVRGKAANDFSK